MNACTILLFCVWMCSQYSTLPCQTSHHVNVAIQTNHPQEETIFTWHFFFLCLSIIPLFTAPSAEPKTRSQDLGAAQRNVESTKTGACVCFCVRVWVGRPVNKWMTKPLAACELKEKSRDWERGDDGEMQQAGGGDNV